jgi:hypothetical protein
MSYESVTREHNNINRHRYIFTFTQKFFVKIGSVKYYAAQQNVSATNTIPLRLQILTTPVTNTARSFTLSF